MSRLEDIAREMEAEAKRRQVAIRELPRGLRVALSWCGGQKVLSLSRPVVRPSRQEVAICRSAFHVPDEVEAEESDVTVRLRWPS